MNGKLWKTRRVGRLRCEKRGKLSQVGTGVRARTAGEQSPLSIPRLSTDPPQRAIRRSEEAAHCAQTNAQNRTSNQPR